MVTDRLLYRDASLSLKNDKVEKELAQNNGVSKTSVKNCTVN